MRPSTAQPPRRYAFQPVARRPPVPLPPVWEQGRIGPQLPPAAPRRLRRLTSAVLACAVVAAIVGAPGLPAQLSRRVGGLLEVASDRLAERAFQALHR